MTRISGRFARTLAHLTAAAAIVGTSLVAAQATQATQATAAEPDGPHYQQPSVGQCRTFTLAQGGAESNNSPVIPCSRSHTAKTFHVGQLPSGLTWSSTATQIGAAVGKQCWPAFDKALGGTERVRRMSAYTLFWFQPNPTQQAHGARWFRCDVAIWGHYALIPLPTNVSPLLSQGLKYNATRCMFGSKNTYTACSKAHHHRAKAAFTFTGTTYPGDQAIARTTSRRCSSLLNSRDFIYVAPNRTSWRYGDRVAVCYAHTSH